MATKKEAEGVQEDFVDSSPVVNDPLRDIANPQVSVSYQNDEDIPVEIKEFLDVHGLPERSYRCILKHIPEGWTDRAQAPYIRSWANTFPSIEFIAKEYGPGEYILVFQWRGKDPESGKIKNSSESLSVFVDENYRDEYEEYQLKKQIARSERQKKMVQQAKLKSELTANLLGPPRDEPVQDKLEAGKQYLREVVEVSNMLGLSRQSQGTDWSKILGIVLPMLPAVMEMLSKRATAESDKLEKIYTLLIAQQSESSRHLLELVKTQAGPSTSSDVMKEMRDMVFGAIDIKEALQGGKQSLGDRIFDLVQGVAPQVLEIAMKSKPQQEMDPRYHMAKAYMSHAPEFQQLKQDPTAQVELIKRLDSYFGWEQTDIIMNVGGIQRPAECPKRPDQRYPANDPRNGGNAPRQAPPAAAQANIADAEIEEDNPMGEE